MSLAYKHIIWDWNGTLLDDTQLCIDVINGILKKRGKTPISEADYRENFTFPVIQFYDYLGFDTNETAFDVISREFIDSYQRRWFNECRLQIGTIDVLNQLSALGLTHSILSAAEQTSLEKGIKHFEIENHFMGFAGINNIYANGKIQRGRDWIKYLPFKPNEIVLIGDTIHDSEVAKHIETDCILVSQGHCSHKRLNQTKYSVTKNLSEIISLIKTTNLNIT